MQTRSNMQPEVNIENERTSKLLTSECIQNWSETNVIENCRRIFLFVDTKQVLEEEIHLVMSEHSIVKTELNLKYTITETRKEHRSLSFASSKRGLKEFSMQIELLQECANVTTVLQHAQQAKPSDNVV